MPVVQYIEAIPREFVKQDVLSATVRVYVGRLSVRRQDLWEVLGRLEADIVNVYRMEKAYEWFVTFVNAEKAEKFCEANVEVAYAGGSLFLSMLDKQVISVRVHWVPDFIDQDFLERIVSEWGRIRSVEISQNMFRFELVVSLQGAHEVPHLVVLPDGRRMLVTMPGRQPMCLKCGDLGHVRSSCGRGQGRGDSQPVPMLEDVSCVQVETQTDVSCFGHVEQESQVDLPTVLGVSQETQVDLPAVSATSTKSNVASKTTVTQGTTKSDTSTTVTQGNLYLRLSAGQLERKKESYSKPLSKEQEDRIAERMRQQDRDMEQRQLDREYLYGVDQGRGYMKRRSETESGQVVKSGRVNVDHHMSDSDTSQSPSRQFLDEKYDYDPRARVSRDSRYN